MPYGEGTYGSKVGRPKKKKTTVRKGKLVMPKAKTDLRGTTADKIIGPTARGLKKSGREVKRAVKKASTKVVGAASKAINKGRGAVKKAMSKPRRQKRRYTNNTYTEGE